MQGTVKWFNEAKGFGFIGLEDGREVFVHYSQIEGKGFRSLMEDDKVNFTLQDGPKGLYAENVSRA